MNHLSDEGLSSTKLRIKKILWVKEKDGNEKHQRRRFSVKLQGKKFRSMPGAGIRDGVREQGPGPTRVG